MKFYFDLQKCIEIAENMVLPRAEDVMLKYIEQNYKGGEIVPINVPRSACQAIDLLYFCKLDCADLPVNGVLSGVLNKDVEYTNNDPYQTAGGYIGGIAKKGTRFTAELSYDYTGFVLRVYADVNILQDHYNNNICGNSTGGGNSEYEQGERVENHCIYSTVNHYDFSTSDRFNPLFVVDGIDRDGFKSFIASQK